MRSSSAGSLPRAPRFGLLCAALAACLGLGGGASAQVLGPASALRLIETPSFDIYFPPALEAEGALLASFAEEIRAEFAARLGLEESAEARGPGGRSPRPLPILLTNAYGELNGHYSPYPSERIVLQAVPPELDGELGAYSETLRLLFTHELAHALSLSIRGPLGKGLAFLLGDPLIPAYPAAPLSFAEGLGVAAESAQGEGRLADPRSLALLRQSLAEGKAPSFWQAAGARDLYPFASNYYLFGGAFSAWLGEKYGEEAYAALWKSFGSLRDIESGLFWKGAFRKNYGLSLDQAWALFLEDLAMKAPLVTALQPLVESEGYITALTAGSSGDDTWVYWADASAGAVLALRLPSDNGAGEGAAPGRLSRGKPERLFAADGHVNRLALSPDGKRLLVSTARLEGEFSRLLVKEWDLEAGRFLGPGIEGLREAAYAGVAEVVAGVGAAAGAAAAVAYPIVAIAPRAFASELVLEKNGERRILLSLGNEGNAGPPLSLGDSIFLIARKAGRNSLLRIDGKGIRVLSAGRELEGLRYLGASAEASSAVDGAESLVFGFAEPGGLYRLGILEEARSEQPRLRYQEAELSGGVQLPSLVSRAGRKDELYYLARLAEGELPAAYDFDNPALALREAETVAAWLPLEPSFTSPEPSPPQLSRPAPRFPLLGRTFRFPSFSEDLDAAGLVILGEDLSGRLAWDASAEYSWGAGAASLGLGLELRPSPWLLRIGLLDDFSRLGEASYLRQSSASIELERSFRFFPVRRQLGLGLSLKAGALDIVEPGAAYAGDYDYPLLAGKAWFEYADLRSAFFPPFALAGGSARLSLDAELGLDSSRPALGLGLKLLGAIPGPRLELELHAALGLDGGLRFGTERRSLLEAGILGPSLLAPDYPSYLEYGSLSVSGSLYGFGEARIILAAAEIQERLFRSRLYFRRLLLRAGLRGAAIGGALSGSLEPLFLSSAFGRLDLELSPLFGSLARYGLVLGLELAYPFMQDYAENEFRLGLVLGLRL